MSRPTISPLPGFNWQLVNWGAPDEAVSEDCSYCGQKLREDEVPLRLWDQRGWAAQFCEHCGELHWGMRVFRDPVEPDELCRDEP